MLLTPVLAMRILIQFTAVISLMLLVKKKRQRFLYGRCLLYPLASYCCHYHLAIHLYFTGIHMMLGGLAVIGGGYCLLHKRKEARAKMNWVQ